MKILSGLVASLVLGGVACGQGVLSGDLSAGAAAGKRPITFADLQRMRRVSDPQISPSGKWVMFSVVDVDLAANTKTSHLWVVPMGGNREQGTGNSGQGVAGADGAPGGGGDAADGVAGASTDGRGAVGAAGRERQSRAGT